mgnify:CR=1 FL=1
MYLALCFQAFRFIKKVQSQLDRVLGITRENLTGVRVIRAFNKEEERNQPLLRQRMSSLQDYRLFVGKDFQH